MNNKIIETNDQFRQSLNNIINIKENKVEIINKDLLRSDLIDKLIRGYVFGTDKEVVENIKGIIRKIATASNIYPSSIQGLYTAMGKGEVSGFTVPAINIRGLTYDVSRSIFRSALKNNTSAFIFEIARSEIGYTKQRPIEYSTVILAAAIKENYTGPVFIQGDHFQVNAKRYAAEPAGEINYLKGLIKEGIEAGFYNIDLDCSTLVDLSKTSINEQQRLNYELVAEFTSHVRSLEPKGITVSVGGEIGEVGGKNSTVEELRGFMDNYKKTLKGNITGISKISVQTGTSHGGVVLSDGSVAKVKLDFNTLKDLSKAAREEYGLAGAVQHGASTLPDDAFDHFPKTETAEVHLATGFQNMIFESKNFPHDLKEEIYTNLRKECADEKKETDTDEQFIYKTRKKAFGSFKRAMWDMPEEVRNSISAELEAKFDFLFHKLNVLNTKDAVDKYVKTVGV